MPCHVAALFNSLFLLTERGDAVVRCVSRAIHVSGQLNRDAVTFWSHLMRERLNVLVAKPIALLVEGEVELPAPGWPLHRRTGIQSNTLNACRPAPLPRQSMIRAQPSGGRHSPCAGQILRALRPLSPATAVKFFGSAPTECGRDPSLPTLHCRVAYVPRSPRL